MTAATIRPLPSGQALLSWRGVEQIYPDVWAARDEAAALHNVQSVTVLPFPMRTPGVEVLTVAPALRVLT